MEKIFGDRSFLIMLQLVAATVLAKVASTDLWRLVRLCEQ